MELMNPNERMHAAMKGLEVDRIPVVPKIWVDLAANLTHTDIRQVITDPLIALRVIAQAGMELGVDAVRLFHFPVKKIREEDGAIFEINPAGRILGKIDLLGGLATHLFNDSDFRIEDPLMMAYCHSWETIEPIVKSLKDARLIAVPDAAVFDHLGWAERQQVILNEFSDKLCLIGDLDTATMSFYLTFRGMENAMIDLIIDPELVHAVMEKGVEIAISRGKYLLDHGIRILRINDSTGNMSLISPEHWKEFVYPHIKTVCDELHHYHRDALIYCHICGNVLPVIHLLVDTGLDCIGPLDPLGGFTVEEARQKAGTGVALMGGVNTMTLLNGTPEQVKAESIMCMEQAGDLGGFILGSGCVVPRNEK
jgi:uroporphyrinogen-III decarboxylase